MSWQDEIKKEDFDWDKEIKNIFDKLGELAVKYNIYTHNEPAMQSLVNSLHDLEHFYESNKEK
jgi:hypothetical protein